MCCELDTTTAARALYPDRHVAPVWMAVCVRFACLPRSFPKPRHRDVKHGSTGNTGVIGTDTTTNNTASSTTSTSRIGHLPGLSPAGSAAAHQLIEGFAKQQADDLRGVQLPSGTPLEALWDQARTLPDLVPANAPTSTSAATTTTTDTDIDADDSPRAIDIDDSDNGDDDGSDDDDFGSIDAVTANDFENEYPMRELPSHEAQAARAATNTFIGESYDRLKARLYTPTIWSTR